MRRCVRRWAPSALLALLLAGCTGTFEDRPPILLAIAFDDGSPQIALVRDSFATGASGGARELTFLEASRRPLPAPAVAFDVVDRAGLRPTLVVLSRETSAPHTGYLRAFDLRDIDPEAPAAFAEDGDFARNLTELLRAQPELADDVDYCLVHAQISSSGRYLALLEDRSACGSDDLVAVYLLDLQRDRLVAAIDTEPLVAADPYLDQRLDLLYFVGEGVSNASLESLTVSTGEKRVVAEITGQNQVDLARIGAPIGSAATELLVALSGSSFQPVDTDADPPEAGTPVNTESGALGFIADDFERSEKLFILGGSRFTVHQSLDDPDGRSASISAQAGTFQPEDLFVYLVAEGRIYIFDALVDDGSGNPTLAPFPVPELIDPGPVAWLRGADVIADPTLRGPAD